MGYFYVFLTIAFTVYGQLILKWQVGAMGAFPGDCPNSTVWLLRLLLSPWVVSALVAAFLAFLAWAVALTKLDISHAYPLTSLSFVCVVMSSWIVFGESISSIKLAGLALVVVGVVLGSQG